MLNWIPAELHCHTYHSDGRHTLLELATAAKNLGLKALALTDHNTISGFEEIQDVFEKTGVFIIKGMELTTFYGHVLGLGIHQYVDWRHLNKDNLYTSIEDIHAQGGVVGTAHPFRLGSPICTGCHMDYQLDWSLIDYIEVWSREFPPIASYESAPAISLWDSLLNQGYHIVATCGRDWHQSQKTTSLPISRTFLGLSEEPTNETISSLTAAAIRNKHISFSMAHCIVLDLLEPLKENTLYFCVQMPDLGLAKQWEPFNLSGLVIRLNSDLGYVHEESVAGKNDLAFCVPKGIKWARAELHGHMNNVDTVIGYTNPLFF